MNLKTIREKYADFREYLLSPKGEEGLFLYELPSNFHDHWDLESDDHQKMFQRSFQNSHTRRFWKREGFRPLEAIDLFWELDASMVERMFRDLFYEEHSIDGRISRFIFHCDQMLSIYRKSNPASIFNSHYHDRDYWMIALYLSLRFPNQYALYPDDAFRICLDMFQAKPMPTTVPDLERYFKVCRTLYTLMKKEEGLLEAHEARLEEGTHYRDTCLLLVYEFLCFTAGTPLVP